MAVPPAAMRAFTAACTPVQGHVLGAHRVVCHSRSRIRLTEEYKQCTGLPEACLWHCGVPGGCCSVRSACSGGLAAMCASAAACTPAAMADCALWGHLTTPAACHASDALVDGPACVSNNWLEAITLAFAASSVITAMSYK